MAIYDFACNEFTDESETLKNLLLYSQHVVKRNMNIDVDTTPQGYMQYNQNSTCCVTSRDDTTR